MSRLFLAAVLISISCTSALGQGIRVRFGPEPSNENGVITVQVVLSGTAEERLGALTLGFQFDPMVVAYDSGSVAQAFSENACYGSKEILTQPGLNNRASIVIVPSILEPGCQPGSGYGTSIAVEPDSSILSHLYFTPVFDSPMLTLVWDLVSIQNDDGEHIGSIEFAEDLSVVVRTGNEPHEFVDPTNARPGDLLIYPNPSSTRLNVQFLSEPGERSDLYVYELSGRVVKSIRFPASGIGHTTLSADVSDLIPGTYLMRTGGNGRSRTSIFVVHR
jgi:hypothetical protein